MGFIKRIFGKEEKGIKSKLELNEIAKQLSEEVNPILEPSYQVYGYILMIRQIGEFEQIGIIQKEWIPKKRKEPSAWYLHHNAKIYTHRSTAEQAIANSYQSTYVGEIYEFKIIPLHINANLKYEDQ